MSIPSSLENTDVKARLGSSGQEHKIKARDQYREPRPHIEACQHVQEPDGEVGRLALGSGCSRPTPEKRGEGTVQGLPWAPHVMGPHSSQVSQTCGFHDPALGASGPKGLRGTELLPLCPWNGSGPFTTL